MSQRLIYALGVLLCAALMGTAFYFEYVMDLEPCPLCMLQRLLLVGVGAVLLLALLHGPGRAWRRVYGLFTVLVAGLGVAVAGRHVWLQNLPDDQVPSCGPGLEYILEAFPLRRAIDLIMSGSGECHEVVWSFLGLSIPAWTLLIFCGFVLFGLSLLLRPDWLAPRG